MSFEKVVEPTKPLVTAKFQLVNAYVAFGAKPRTLVAKGDSVFSYVNDPVTPPPSASVPEKSNDTGMAWAGVRSPNSKHPVRKVVRYGLFISALFPSTLPSLRRKNPMPL